MKPGRTAFSLIEIIVVISVLGVLVGLLLPAIQSVRDTASRASCQNNFHQIGLALHDYHGIHNRFPPEASDADLALPNATTRSPAKLLSWMVHLLPQLEQSALWEISVEACRSGARPNQSPPHVGFVTPVKIYTCPSDGRLATAHNTKLGKVVAFTSYIGVAGSVNFPLGTSPPLLAGVFGYYPGCRLADVTDGTSNTLSVGERPPPNTYQAGQWYTQSFALELNGGPDGSLICFGGGHISDPCGNSTCFGPGRLDNPCDRKHFWSLHRNGANFLFVDGSVKFLTHSASSLIPALATRASGELVTIP